MPITDLQREKRKQHLGSSDMAGILGLDPFRSAYDIWCEKTGRLDDSERKETACMTRGNFLEAAILAWFEQSIGKSITRNQYRSAKNEGIPIGTNIDAIINEGGFPVEAKSVGSYSNEVWGEPGTDLVPDRVIIQCHVHMIATDTLFCFVPVYLPYRDFAQFTVPCNTDLKNIICEAAINFWENNVRKDIAPDAAPSIDVVKRIRRQPNKTVDIAQTLIDAYIKAQQAESAATKAKDAAQAAILAVMDDAEGAVSDKGQKVTYFEQVRKGYVVEESSYRVLRFPKK